jgi:hypothetical protein
MQITLTDFAIALFNLASMACGPALLGMLVWMGPAP